MKNRSIYSAIVIIAQLAFTLPELHAAFDLDISISASASFTPEQEAVLEAAIVSTEALWESKITGYQAGISLTGITVDIRSDSNIFANAQFTGTTQQGGFVLNTQGIVRINPAVIDLFKSWDGQGPTIPNTEFVGVNYVDDILMHEVGHILGLNGGNSQSTWARNGVYVPGSGEYRGQYGVAAYKAEFDPTAEFIPVEKAGGAGARDSHWDQIFRSNQDANQQEGVLDTGANPFDLDPRTGITDSQGRDLAFELMTGTVDPDYGEPFLSNMTVQSFRDIGFTVVPEPSSWLLLLMGALMLTRRQEKP